jgi:RNA polymerase sigma-70 factor (ECF subfamily)
MVMIQGEDLDQRAAVLLDPGDQSDDVLLARLRVGDEAAFRALVDRHRPWLVRLCTRLLGSDAHGAEDAAQESLLKLHAAARRDGRPLRVRPWLTVVARNTCIDEQRRRRPDLPGELPEQAAQGEDVFQLDAALAEAWSHLSGRHREVLYLREVLGFSYKEIGAVMGLTMAATETLVFRARAALRREYERSGGSSFGCVLLGLQLTRLGAGHRRDGAAADGVSTVVANDAGFTGLTGRLAHFLSTSLPGCGEQAMAKVLSVAAGVIMAAASVTAGLGPFADTPSAAADDAPAAVTAAPAPVIALTGGAATGIGTSPAPAAVTGPMALKALVGNVLPADWAPRARTESAPVPAPESGGAETDARPPPITSLRDAAAAVRSSDRPTLRQGDSGEGPLRSRLPERPRSGDVPERPHALRALISDLRPLLTDPLPVEPPPPAEPLPTEPPPTGPLPTGPLPTGPTPTEPTAGVISELPAIEPEARPQVKETLEPAIATFAGDEPTPVRLRDR